jgi:Zn-dependent protease
MAIIGAAGPASNLFLAIVLGIVFKLSNNVLGPGSPLTNALFYGVYINLVLAFFNLVPVPPLDGSRIVMAFLPDDLAIQYAQIERFGFLIIFGLLFLGLFQILIFPIVRLFLNLIIGSSF